MGLMEFATGYLRALHLSIWTESKGAAEYHWDARDQLDRDRAAVERVLREATVTQITPPLNARRCVRCGAYIVPCVERATGRCIGRGWMHASSRRHACELWRGAPYPGAWAAAYPMADARWDSAPINVEKGPFSTANTSLRR